MKLDRLEIFIQTQLQRIFLQLGFHISRSSDVNEVRNALQELQASRSVPMYRAGARADGGYLLPQRMGSVDAVFSPGIATEVGFEWDFASQGVDCFLIDGSVDGPPIEHPKFSFRKLWLGAVNNADTIRLDTWVEQSGYASSRNLILQIDVEGAEYGVIAASSPETLSKFKVIVIELHDLRAMASRQGLRQLKSTMHSLLETHQVVASHVNNTYPPLRWRSLYLPEVLELTLFRNDLVDKAQASNLAAENLHRPNSSNKDWQDLWILQGLGNSFE